MGRRRSEQATTPNPATLLVAAGLRNGRRPRSSCDGEAVSHPLTGRIGKAPQAGSRPPRWVPEPLTTHRQRPIPQSALMHPGGGLAPEGVNHGYLLANDIRIVVDLTELEQVRH